MEPQTLLSTASTVWWVGTAVSLSWHISLPISASWRFSFHVVGRLVCWLQRHSIVLQHGTPNTHDINLITSLMSGNSMCRWWFQISASIWFIRCVDTVWWMCRYVSKGPLQRKLPIDSVDTKNKRTEQQNRTEQNNRTRTKNKLPMEPAIQVQNDAVRTLSETNYSGPRPLSWRWRLKRKEKSWKGIAVADNVHTTSTHTKDNMTSNSAERK
jgi:hypothetical protein